MRHGHLRAMHAGERRWLYAMATVLGISGFGWWMLELFGAQPGPFGPTPHPLLPAVRLIHGAVAVPALFLLGWVAGRHARPQWKRTRRRLSGGGFAAILCALVVTGFALFFIDTDAAQHVAALSHEWLGLAALAWGIEHWSWARRGAPDQVLRRRGRHRHRPS